MHRGLAGADLDELLDGEIFYTLREARTVIESWRRYFNGVRPHSALGYQAPAPETTVLLPPLASSVRGSGSARQATAGAKTDAPLTLQLDHLVGAAQAFGCQVATSLP